MNSTEHGRTAPGRDEMDYRAAFAAHADDVLPPGYAVVHRLAPIRPALDGDRVFWIIDGPTGRFSASTRHSYARIPADEDLDLMIARHETALADLLVAKSLLEGGPTSPES